MKIQNQDLSEKDQSEIVAEDSNTIKCQLEEQKEEETKTHIQDVCGDEDVYDRAFVI